MRLVLDTNIVISGLLWHGAPRKLLDLVRLQKAEIFTCEELLAELGRVCGYAKFYKKISAAGINIDMLQQNYSSFTKKIIVSKPVPQLCRDINDDIVLACAAKASADLIVTGDVDLLVMKQYQNIPIIQVTEAVRRIQGTMP
ncbi:putative toxin-antitoxin system toxin component, PIN family [Pseudoduganella sp. FT26W]|jgi:putative PIN family toxin of toxin-antitoxin system|uniref:Putative toxin-antitoxin system toxin component, PIN family n=1 Tax=Duganella aquatilis TaxID=2666082 RepID=A0A844DER8_9BURK|nr:putative toxin-antitoxin system toxin component, PIN family [Duganella aquatilis]MRW86334.1 putative toxin-antitoxin system toxin component, PIN family [Duganella aquatilis]